MSKKPKNRRARIAERAGNRCEYCRLAQAMHGGTLHIEHVRPQSRGGRSGDDNLALACPLCNLRKGDRVQAADPDGGKYVPLFDPRRHRWRDHFAWRGSEVDGLTPVGRATVALLRLNEPHRLGVRTGEALMGLFPPPDDENDGDAGPGG